jgi:RNA polymerase sigma-70 factor, ECF subfamily
MDATLFMDDSLTEASDADLSDAPAELRVADLVRRYYDFVWRSLRRLGVRDGDADDASQKVFLTAARKLEAIRPGCESSYLYQTAIRVASDYRRSKVRRTEASFEEHQDGPNPSDTSPTMDELVDMRRARVKLDAVLDSMPMDLRAVFVLHELEQSTMAEIAEILELPNGTVASRLRRARRVFLETLERQLGRAPFGELFS